MPAPTIDVINTSNLAKLYHTTTADVEKKLTTLGHKPVRTVIQQSGRRFMLWDRQATIAALEDYKNRREREMAERSRLRQEILTRTYKVPANDDTSLDDSVMSGFAGLDEIPSTPREDRRAGNKELLTQMEELRETVRLQTELLQKLLEAQQ